MELLAAAVKGASEHVCRPTRLPARLGETRPF